jgi:hypothetical protein
MLIVKNTLLFIFFLCMLITSSVSSASKENHYILQKIAQAPQQATGKNQWLLLREQPGNSQYYYLASKQGKIYQLEQDSPDNTTLLVDLQHVFTESPLVQLTAFTLHPNFSLPDQIGFGTFYTAHIEKSTNHNKTSRLEDLTITIPLDFDAILTEWQLTPNKKINLSNQREVLRIGFPTAQSGIRQLNFNPYSKSWHENFAQLYISLSASPKLKERPLYSGAILRIHPQQKAKQSYTVPHENPYYANREIEQTLYLFGAGKIEQFIWTNKYSTKLLISHQYSVKNSLKHWLSYSNGGEDWRQHEPKEYIYQHTSAANNLLVYRGQNAPNLRNKLLMLTQKNQQWHLNSLPSDISQDSRDVSQQQALSSPVIEWQLSQPVLQAKHLTLYRDNRGELLFFNEDSGAIYQLFQQDMTISSQTSKKSDSLDITLLFVIMLVLLGFYIAYRIFIHHNSAKSIVRREFSNLTLTKDKLSIKLFRRHQHQAEKVISLADVKQCQIMLGDLVVATINTTLGHSFNEQHEQSLREIFRVEKIEKMIDRKVRRLNLVLNTQDKGKYIVCLYFRKGSDRITKKSYYEVVDDIIDWCWFIAQAINTSQTRERPLKPKVITDDVVSAEKDYLDDTPLHAQAANIRPVTHLSKISTISDVIEPEKESQATLSENKKTTSANLHSADNITSVKVETELVNALEKLVKLQQQGFLTADEFELAKAQLLTSSNQTE